MTEALQQQLYRCVFEGEQPGDHLVDQIAESADAQAELVRLASVLANLPGDGARESEARLDALLEAVTLAAVGHVVTAQAQHSVTS